jgi:hypothetical protein
MLGRPRGNGVKAQVQTWDERLFALSYTMFGLVAPSRPDPWSYWATTLGTAVYCAAGVVIFLTLNIVMLPIGILAEPIWRPKASFRILRLRNGFPIMPFPGGALFGYATYNTWVLRGAVMAIGPWAFVSTLSVIFFGVAMAYNRLRAPGA